MKPLIKVSASDVSGLTRALESALAGGPAVWPVPGDASVADAVATEVDDRIALVVETSGSTDAPKRVLLSADALTASADATHDALGGQGRWLLALPGHYIAGAQVLVRSILAGTSPVVIASAIGAGFDVREFAEASATLDPRTPAYTSLVPVQLARLVDAAERDAFVAAALTSYDAILVGGQALAAPIAGRAAHLGARVVRTYGSSETSGGCVYDGVPLAGVEVRADRETDEVLLSGPTLADGYLGDPDRTARAFVAGSGGRRWYRTGDLGGLGADGRLRIRGRADDVIISGGVKVALGEIERAVRALDGFHDAVAVAVDDPEWGQRAVIVVAEASGAFKTPGALETSGAPEVTLARATDAAGLPPAGRPVRLVVLDALPMLASGKPDRAAIARLAAE
ncbi:hypothetical protein ET445_01890 [Agromyces protaetiae]|uniref:AMP-dependent synthetase/ligase domain-containing protein n=1 Tax=Agromyces protaetiae TaxID=2509455 RepID=A0A4P6F8U4_9MICO|nr:AMP-binding protein [Agromyces protaetiae]QAY72272.1 hypothetical protein ET445_01890 [Agromyces protaetiae]